jgi:hypothetical protein
MRNSTNSTIIMVYNIGNLLSCIVYEEALSGFHPLSNELRMYRIPNRLTTMEMALLREGLH